VIDATRSPRPVWKRYLTIVLLMALIAALAWTIWVEELHHAIG
jgi:hypothetical protein